MQAEAAGQAAKQFATQAGRGLSRGAGGFLRPFRRVGGIVWLEVTGTFFLLFAALFALRLWQNWAGMGGAAKGFVIGAAVVFLYLGVSSFWRARRR
jgi:O-antigen/teichoic acid export membrane protein